MSRVDLTPNISGALAVREAEGHIRVLRALLIRPVLRAPADGELFRLARRHAETLRGWFDRETGWRLVVESQTVRLLTSYIPQGPTAISVAERHPARGRRGDPPFTRRRYVLLCLALAVLERSDPQISLGRLAEDVVLAARQPGLKGVAFTLSGREERSDLVAAIRLLLGHGVLVRVAGGRGIVRFGGRRCAVRRRPAGTGHDAVPHPRARPRWCRVRSCPGDRPDRGSAARAATGIHG